MEISDKTLIEQVKEGDKSKMGPLYERHHRDLFAYFYRMTRDKNKSEDLVQNVFFRMLKYSHNFKGQGKFVYWMFSIARNIWIDDYRKANPLKNVSALDQIDQSYIKSQNDIEQNYELKEKRDILKFALGKISPEQREAIVLSRYHDMKYKEIASITNCTENTVKSRIKRGIVELQTIVQQIQPN